MATGEGIAYGTADVTVGRHGVWSLQANARLPAEQGACHLLGDTSPQAQVRGGWAVVQLAGETASSG